MDNPRFNRHEAVVNYMFDNDVRKLFAAVHWEVPDSPEPVEKWYLYETVEATVDISVRLDRRRPDGEELSPDIVVRSAGEFVTFVYVKDGTKGRKLVRVF